MLWSPVDVSVCHKSVVFRWTVKCKSTWITPNPGTPTDGSTQRIAEPQRWTESRTEVGLICTTKSGEDRSCGSGDMLADKQTDRHGHHDTSPPLPGQSRNSRRRRWPWLNELACIRRVGRPRRGRLKMTRLFNHSGRSAVRRVQRNAPAHGLLAAWRSG